MKLLGHRVSNPGVNPLIYWANASLDPHYAHQPADTPDESLAVPSRSIASAGGRSIMGPCRGPNSRVRVLLCQQAATSGALLGPPAGVHRPLPPSSESAPLSESAPAPTAVAEPSSTDTERIRRAPTSRSPSLSRSASSSARSWDSRVAAGMNVGGVGIGRGRSHQAGPALERCRHTAAGTGPRPSYRPLPPLPGSRWP